MPPSVRRVLNGGVGGYDFDEAGVSYDGQEGVQHLLLVNISSLYAVSLLGRRL